MSRKITGRASRQGKLAGRALRLAFSLALLSTLSIACSDDGDGDDLDGLPQLATRHEPTCAGYVGRLRACDLLTGGKVTCSDPDTPAEQCIFDCLTQASCSLLMHHHCGSTMPALARCFAFCEYFPCDEGYLIPSSWVCDYAPDCDDGTDEVDCEYFQCGSGEMVGATAQCDAYADCIDGSDEVECPKFTCSDGRQIPEQWHCDFAKDCSDGGDEVGCNRFVCEVNGQELPASYRCDLQDDCLDGADEVGCAQLLCN